MDRVLYYEIQPEFDEANVITVLKQHFKISTNLIKELKKYPDGLLLDGEHVRTVDTVKTGNILRVTIRDGESENIIPKNIPINIAYEDEDILILNKPPHMPTHPSMGNYDNSLANGVMYYYKSKGESRVFRAVNRLDKDTSGLMAVAKNAYIHARLGEEIRSGQLKRKYNCIVCGDIEHGGTVDAPIKRDSGSVINRIVAADGQRAVTHYKVKARYGSYTLLEMQLETGRTHQIRVHMAHIGHPLAGDWLYGVEDKSVVKRQMLHSCYISLIHPVTGKIIERRDEMSQDMREFIEKISEKH